MHSLLSKTKQIISFFPQFLSLFRPEMAALIKNDQVQCFSDFDGSFLSTASGSAVRQEYESHSL